MEQAGGHLCQCHWREHQALLAFCDRAAGLGRHDWRHARSLLWTSFPRLIREHIDCMDQIAVLFINTNSGLHAAG
jgi:hypothetical protein